MTINNFIKKRPYLVWHTKDLDNLSKESIVEAVLNFGDWDDVQEMIKIIGLKETAFIFRKQLKKKRCNYSPMIKNYFNLYFNKKCTKRSLQKNS